MPLFYGVQSFLSGIKNGTVVSDEALLPLLAGYPNNAVASRGFRYTSGYESD